MITAKQERIATKKLGDILPEGAVMQPLQYQPITMPKVFSVVFLFCRHHLPPSQTLTSGGVRREYNMVYSNIIRPVSRGKV